MHLDLNALRAFVRTIERGSVTGAARDLAISQPAVTKHLRNLERHVSARLFERTSRSIRPTSHGLAFYESSRTALAELDAALEGVRRDMGAIEGTLRIFAPSCLGSHQLYELVATFQAEHPDVVVDLVLDMRQVDLVHENFDLAVGYTRPKAQETIVRRVGSVRRIIAASPDFLNRYEPIEKPEDLSTLNLVATMTVLSSRNTILLCRAGETIEVTVRPTLKTNNAQVLVKALQSGRHIGPVQTILVLDDLASGQLIRVLPEYEVKTNDVYISYPSTRYMRPAVRAFVDFLISGLKAVEGIDQG